MVSHAAYPTPVWLSDDHLRVFIVARDSDNRGSVGWVDLDPQDPTQVVAVSETPALRPGPTGTFYDRGISIGSIHRRPDGALWMYFLGWNKSADVPFRNSIGLAIDRSGRGDRFEPAFEGPLIDRSRHDPFTLSYPYTSPPQATGCRWHMLYGTSRGGGLDERQMQHALSEAWSSDGIDWSPTGRDVIPLEEGEYGLSRPWIFDALGARQVVFAIRRAQYTIGWSSWDPDAGIWHRQSRDLLGPGAKWDGEATCYPAVTHLVGRILLFYNGNGYGRTGFGVAEWTGR
ncbi:hypothetical protein B7H23_07120 [Notoacmeibacter marinus]|uniref:Glycosyl hydrolase family 32 N-terminal domain-containing protein n=2 Tax=Notoacmeibacter marinus TaxID=1876515 RepID=A0A231V3C2_9HYPH|nr:hypothetical protein B7H23_07120 [Notoacmeibacter marinus]